MTDNNKATIENPSELKIVVKEGQKRTATVTMIDELILNTFYCSKEYI
jgi:hypothetical protein